MKTLYKIVYGFFAMVLISIAVLFFAPASPLLGGVDVKIVKSGSMEPGIITGGIVVIHESPSYVPGDIITFQSQGADIPTTHRIVSEQQEDGKMMFVTKGDANEEADTALAARETVLGKVLFTVPYVGFILDFARQPIGFGLLIVLPALLIVIDEVEKIWKELRRRRKSVVVRKFPETLVVEPFVPAPRVLMMDINRPAFLHTERAQRKVPAPQMEKRATPFEPSWVMATSVVLIATTFMVNMWSIGGTISYFNDTETATQNSLGANALDFTAIPADATFTFTDGVLDNPDGLITLVAPETGSVLLKYSVWTEYGGGNQAFCDAITVETADPFNYSGPLTALTASGVSFSSSWALAMSLVGDGAYQPGDTCVIDIVYRGWNALLAEGSGGYGDEERTQLTFTAPTQSLAPAARFMMEVPEILNLTTEVPPEEVTNEGATEENTDLNEINPEPPVAETPLEETIIEEVIDEASVPEAVTPPISDTEGVIT